MESLLIFNRRILYIIIINILISSSLFSIEPDNDDEEEIFSSDIQNTLDKQVEVERVHVVQKKKYTKINKLELSVRVGFIPDDPYWFNTQTGGAISFHWNDMFGLELANFKYNFFSERGLQKNLRDQEVTLKYNHSNYMFNSGVLFTPIYAKSNLLKQLVVYFDLYLSLGMGFIKTELDTPLFYYIGPGIRFYLSKKLLLRFDFQSMIYSGKSISGSDKTAIGVVNILNMSGGLSVFLF